MKKYLGILGLLAGLAIFGALKYNGLTLGSLISSKIAPTETAPARVSLVFLKCPDRDIFNSEMTDTNIKFDFDGKSYDLPHVEAASGAKYANDEIEFWNKGEEVTITLSATPDAPIVCETR